jgi:hypothetical protein
MKPNVSCLGTVGVVFEDMSTIFSEVTISVFFDVALYSLLKIN